MSAHPFADANPVPLFILLSPRNRDVSQSHPESNTRRRCSRVKTQIKNRCKCVAKFAKKCCKKGAKIAKEANIPILEEAGNDEWSVSERIGAAVRFVISVIAACVLCLYLEAETTKNPMEEELVGVDIAKGPLPAVEIRLENMFTPMFLDEMDRTFSNGRNNSHHEFSTGMEEKFALAYLVGQLTAGKHPVFQTILKFLDKANSSGVTFVPKNRPGHPAMKTAIELTKLGIIGCHDVIKNCRLRGDEENCTELFSSTLTPRGLGCSFNAVPASGVERIDTIRAQISQTIDPEKNRHWKGMDKDAISFANEEREFFPIKNQGDPGEGSGITFTIDPPPKFGTSRFFLSVGNPRDHAVTKATETKYSFTNSHHLSLTVVAEYYTLKVKQNIIREKRKCSFYDEGNPGNYDGYTFQRCFSSAGAKGRDCLLVGEIDHGQNISKRLCHPSLLVSRYFQLDEQEFRTNGHNECPKSCNDIHYSFTDKPEGINLLDRVCPEIHLFFSTDEVISRVKDVKGFTAEQIGIVLGMLGFCNDITLPKLLKICGTMAIALATLGWKKIRQCLDWRHRNRPTTLFLPLIW